MLSLSSGCRRTELPSGNPRSHQLITTPSRSRADSNIPRLIYPPPGLRHFLHPLPFTTSVEIMFRTRQTEDALKCGAGGSNDTHFGLRIGSIFIILVGATGGALFPVLVKRSKRINLPGYVFEYVHPFFRLSFPTTDPIQVCKIFRIRCDRASNPNLPERLP